jgi:hypothetical protein
MQEQYLSFKPGVEENTWNPLVSVAPRDEGSNPSWDTWDDKSLVQEIIIIYVQGLGHSAASWSWCVYVTSYFSSVI